MARFVRCVLGIVLLGGWGARHQALALTLVNSPGDGQVSVSLDAYGSFGYRAFGVGTGDAVYDPVGAVGPRSTTWESAVYFRMAGSSGFLSTGEIGTTGASGNRPDPGFTSTGTTTATSSFTYAGLAFGLEQRLEDLLDGMRMRTGSILTQTYTITNPVAETVSFDLLRYYEGDLFLGGAGVPDGGGHLILGGTEYVFETDIAGQPADSTNFIGITGVGGTLPSAGRYEVGKWPDFPARVSADLPLGDVVFNDGPDADEFVDAGMDYDVGIALANSFKLGASRQAVYVTRTVFGTGVPAELPTTTTTMTTSTTTRTTTTTTTTTTITTSTMTTTTTTMTATTTTSTTTTRPPAACSGAAASPAVLWPPNHQFVTVSVVGVTDADGDAVAITIRAITQDEALNGVGEGNTCPDATGLGTAGASVRVEREGGGDGRVYHISFTADDGRGGRCTGIVAVCVPHDQAGQACGDQGPLADSTGPTCVGACTGGCAIEMALAQPVCTDENLPAALVQRLDKAQRLIAQAAGTSGKKKAKKLMRRGIKAVKQAAGIAAKAAKKGTISSGCAAAVATEFSNTKASADRWLSTR